MADPTIAQDQRFFFDLTDRSVAGPRAENYKLRHGCPAGVTFFEHSLDITVFDGTGMALEDAAVVHLAYHMARERGLGKVIDLQ